jgi:hypothetical protein
MRAIVLSCVLLAFVAPGRAAVHDEIINVFASMAAALSDDNVPGFMKEFDRQMSGYDDLKRQITAMLLDSEISSEIEPLKDEGTGTKRTVDVDWYLELHSRSPEGPTRRRRKIVHCELQLEGKHWRITSLDPMSFFTETME